MFTYHDDIGLDRQPRFYGVTVSTEDFKSFSRGSIPRGTSLFIFVTYTELPKLLLTIALTSSLRHKIKKQQLKI